MDSNAGRFPETKVQTVIHPAVEIVLFHLPLMKKLADPPFALYFASVTVKSELDVQISEMTSV